MWCKRCQQDTPGIAGGDGAIRCIRCGSAVFASIRGGATGAAAAAAARAASPKLDPPAPDVALADLSLDITLRAAESALQRAAPHFERAVAATTPAPAVNAPFDARPAAPAQNEPSNRQAGSAVGWMLLLVGTAALACGAVLAGWSLAADAAHLWNIGFPVLLGGQAALLVGILLQVERMWRNGRTAADRLARVDRQLGDLEQTTSLLGNTYGAGSSAFYAHMAEGASPRLLLADLKSQVDLLAMKVARGG